MSIWRRDHDSTRQGDAENVSENDAASFPQEDAGVYEPDSPLGTEPANSTQRYVVLMCAQFLFMVEFSQFIMDPPLQEIMEDFACHSLYPEHPIGAPQAQDARCKESDVQRTLAMARSWMMWAELLVPLLVQIPYGLVADRYGRRLVLFLGLFGALLSTCWYMIVLLHPDTFSIWHLLLGSIPTLIGGGGPVIAAMVWTIVTDSVSIDKRTSLFYQLMGMVLILSAALRPLAAWLLTVNPWLPMWMGLCALVLSLFSALLIPETLHLRTKEDKYGQEEAGRKDQTQSEPPSLDQDVFRGTWDKAKAEISRIWQFMSGSKSTMLLVLGYSLCYPIQVAFEMSLLQYITKRFDWDWSRATYFTTISKVASVVTLLVFLPLCSSLLTKRLRLDPLTRDLWLSRGSLLFILAGTVLAAFAASPFLLVASLIFRGLAMGIQPQLRALLAVVVEPHNLATMNTAIATVETLVGLASVPTLGWLLSKGIDLGGAWIGLPFMLTSACALLSAATIFVFRMPRELAVAQGGYELLRHNAED